MQTNQPQNNRGLRFFNEVVYELMPAYYNAMDWLTFGAWWRLVRVALDYVPEEGKLLEIAFGPGRLHEELAQRAEFCVGLDLAWGMCRFTKQRLQRAQLPTKIVQGSVFNLPYADNCFNTIVSTFAFSGFPNGQKALHEIKRVTAVNGQIIFVDIGLPTDSNRLGTFFAKLWQKMGDYLYDIPQMMQDEGLTITTFKEFGPGKHIRVIVAQKETAVSIPHARQQPNDLQQLSV